MTSVPSGRTGPAPGASPGPSGHAPSKRPRRSTWLLLLVVVLAGLLVAGGDVFAAWQDVHTGAEKAVSPSPVPATSPPGSVESVRSAAARSASKLAPPADAAAVRAYLTDGAGARVVLVQHRAALHLLDAHDSRACTTVLSELADFPPGEATSTAAATPDPITAGLLTQERSAISRVLTGCLHPDRVSEEHRSAARHDLEDAAGVVDLRLDTIGVQR